MAAPKVYPKIYVLHPPSLFHLALVKVALPLYKEYGGELLGAIHENLTGCDECIPIFPTVSYNKAMETLLFIPTHLRESLFKTVYGLESEDIDWRCQHEFLLLNFGNNISFDKIIYHWRSDGTIDNIKTTRDLILNEDIHIRSRFQIACMYCFESDIQTLWAEIKASGKEQEMERPAIEEFWIKWMSNGTHIHWTEAALEEDFIPFRMSSFFLMLLPGDRKKFLPFFDPTFSVTSKVYDDIRFCLYAMTKEEEEYVMKLNALAILETYLKWPLNSFFLEIAGKMFKYLSYDDYRKIVLTIYHRRCRQEFNYLEILESYWKMSPDHFKVNAKKNSKVIKRFDKYL